MEVIGARRLQRRLVAISLATAILGGCANPYVKLDAPDYSKARESPTPLPVAMDYARTTHRIYREKVVELGDAERNLSNGLVTLGAAILALAASNAHSSAITGTALVGGTAYTLGTFNTDKRRPIIYIAGMRAFECAMDAVLPLNFDSTTQSFLMSQLGAVEADLQHVASAIGRVEAAIQRVDQEGGDAGMVGAARKSTQAARSAITSSNRALIAGRRLHMMQAQAGEGLRSAVDKIDTAILNELRGIENSIQDLPGIIGQLTASTNIFSALARPAPDPTPAAGGDATAHSGDTNKDGNVTRKKPGEQRLSDLAHAVESLESATVILRSHASQLTGFVTGVEKTKPVENLKACKVEGANAPFAVDPLEISFDATTPSRRIIHFSGGNGNPDGRFEPDPAPPGLSSVKFPTHFEINATDQTVADKTYQFVVADTGRKNVQTVTVKIAAGKGGGASPVSKLSDAVTAIVAAKTVDVGDDKVRVTIVAAAVNSNNNTVVVKYSVPDGKAVTDTAVGDALYALADIQKRLSRNQIVPEVDTEAHASAMAKRAMTARWGPVVHGLTREQIEVIQAGLCMQPEDVDGFWGPKTQRALRDDRGRRRAANEQNMPEGNLISAELSTLRSRTAEEVQKRCKR